MTSYTHKTKIQIRFKDIDKLGHVNNANHITYFELARVEYFNALAGKDLKIDWQNEGVILAKIEMEYLQPILLDDEVYVYTSISRMGNKSFDMSCSIVREINGGEQPCAKGLAILVCFNYNSNQTIPIPEKWKTAIQLK